MSVLKTATVDGYHNDTTSILSVVVLLQYSVFVYNRLCGMFTDCSPARVYHALYIALRYDSRRVG